MSCSRISSQPIGVLISPSKWVRFSHFRSFYFYFCLQKGSYVRTKFLSLFSLLDILNWICFTNCGLIRNPWCEITKGYMDKVVLIEASLLSLLPFTTFKGENWEVLSLNDLWWGYTCRRWGCLSTRKVVLTEENKLTVDHTFFARRKRKFVIRTRKGYIEREERRRITTKRIRSN